MRFRQHALPASRSFRRMAAALLLGVSATGLQVSPALAGPNVCSTASAAATVTIADPGGTYLWLAAGPTLAVSNLSLGKSGDVCVGGVATTSVTVTGTGAGDPVVIDMTGAGGTFDGVPIALVLGAGTDTLQILAEGGDESIAVSASQASLNHGTGPGRNGVPDVSGLGSVEYLLVVVGDGTNTVTLAGFPGDMAPFPLEGTSVQGGAGVDTFTAGVGAAQMMGYAGNDVLIGGAGQDALFGGAGDDVLVGLGDADYLVGDADNDLFVGGAGDDLFSDSGGIDTLSYDEVAYPGAAAGGVTFTLASSSPQNTVGAGSDECNTSGSCPIEHLIGSSFNDTLSGNTGANVLRGQGGDDLLAGGAGDDTYVGGAGDDTFNDSAGTDTLSYDDLAFAGAATGGVTFSLNLNTKQTTGGAGGDTCNTSGSCAIEHLTGSSFADVLTGGAGANTLLGQGGGDTLNGVGGDALLGGLGDDVLNGGTGADTLQGGAGGDRLSGGDGDDVLVGGVGPDTYVGGAGIDTISFDDGTFAGAAIGGVTFSLLGTTAQNTGGAGKDLCNACGVERLVGSSFGDRLTGDWGNNRILGLGGSDVLYGSAGADVLDGGSSGNDTLYGQAGNDTLLYGGGTDLLNGEKGTDACQGWTANGAGSGPYATVTYTACESSAVPL